MGKKVVRLMGGEGGWSGRWLGVTVSFPGHCAKTIRLSFSRFGTYFGPHALVVPFGRSYCHCICSFPIIMKNIKKIHFCVTGPELLNGGICMHENLS